VIGLSVVDWFTFLIGAFLLQTIVLILYIREKHKKEKLINDLEKKKRKKRGI